MTHESVHCSDPATHDYNTDLAKFMGVKNWFYDDILSWSNKAQLYGHEANPLGIR